MKLAASVLIKMTQRKKYVSYSKVAWLYVPEALWLPIPVFCFCCNQTFSTEVKSVELIHFVPLLDKDSEVEQSGDFII